MFKKTLIGVNLSILLSVGLNADMFEERVLYNKSEIELAFKVSSSFQSSKDLIDNHYLNGNLKDFELNVIKMKNAYSNSSHGVERAISDAYYAKLLSIKGDKVTALILVERAYKGFNELGYAYKKEKYLLAKYMLDVFSISSKEDDNEMDTIMLDLITNMGINNKTDTIERTISILRHKILTEKVSKMERNGKTDELVKLIADKLNNENGLKVQSLGLLIKYNKRLNNEPETIKRSDELMEYARKGEYDLFMIEALRYAVESYVAYEKNDKAEEAIFILKDLYDRGLDPEHIYYPELYSQLSDLYKRTKDFDNSIKYAKMSLDRYMKTYGEESAEMVNVYSIISTLYFDKGDTEMAEEYLVKAYDLSVRKNGKYDYMTKIINQNLQYIRSIKKNKSIR